MDAKPTTPARKRNGREGKPPAFQFYPADFLVDEAVMLMSMTDVGVYVTLLAFAWREGSIPAGERDRARLCRCSVLVMRQAWERVGRCWEPHETLPLRLINPRQEAARCAHAEWVQSRRCAGIQGGRKSAQIRADLKHVVEHPSTSASASASASALAISESPQKDSCAPDGARCAPFEEFWKVYPIKKAKKPAKAVWSRLHPDRELLAIMIRAIERQKASEQWQQGFIPLPTTWLRQARWDDEFPTNGNGSGDGVASWLAQKLAEKGGTP